MQIEHNMDFLWEEKLVSLYPTMWEVGVRTFVFVRRIQTSSRMGGVSFYQQEQNLKVFVLFHVNLCVLKMEFKGNECSQFALWAPLASNGGAGSASTMVMVARA